MQCLGPAHTALFQELPVTPLLLAVLQAMAPVDAQQEAAAAAQVGSQPGLVPHAHCVLHLHLFALAACSMLQQTHVIPCTL
jgi:hypothetical protein